MDKVAQEALEDFKKSIKQSMLERIDNPNLSIFNLDVLAKAKKLSNNPVDLLSMLVNTVAELEMLKFQLSSMSSLLEAQKRVIEAHKGAEIAEDEFSNVAMEAIYTLGEGLKEAGTELKEAPQKLASAGGKGRSKKYDALKQRVIERYEAKRWKSPRDAAISMEPEIVELSKQLGIPLSDRQAWERIYKWLLRHLKNKP